MISVMVPIPLYKNCVLCGSSVDSWRRIAPIRHKDWPVSFELFKCACGLVFTSLAVDDSDLSSLYEEEYFQQIRFLPLAYASIAEEDEKLLRMSGLSDLDYHLTNRSKNLPLL